MILVDYRGKGDVKYLYVKDRQDLVDCIEWLKARLAKMVEKNMEWDSLIDLTDYTEHDQ